MASVQGPVTLNPGQHTTAVVHYFDTKGAPMPSTFIPPQVVYTIDKAAIATSSPTGDGQTSRIAYGNAGVANLTATVHGPSGPLTDTQVVTDTASGGQVLGSIKLAFTKPTV